MSYFHSITSRAELKKQYRALAMQHRPDRGGDIKAMQAINAEYDVLFAVWRDDAAPDDAQTGAESRRRFYSEYGWAGDRYDRNLGTKEIAVILRDYLKAAHPECKFSITRDYNQITIALMAAPWPALTDEAGPDALRKQHQQTSHSHSYTSNRYTHKANMVLLDAVQFLNQYRYDDSDSMTDYFDTNFYIHTEIGRWNKPFAVEERRARRVNKLRTAA